MLTYLALTPLQMRRLRSGITAQREASARASAALQRAVGEWEVLSHYLHYWYKSTNSVAKGARASAALQRAVEEWEVLSLYLLYWYKSTNVDAEALCC